MQEEPSESSPNPEGAQESGTGPADRIGAEKVRQAGRSIEENIGRMVIGQSDLIEKLLLGILADGHVLIEGVPGVAKTLSAKLLARSIESEFSRIQFTPDLMPSDVIGTSVYEQKEARFSFKKGPVFANILLADEINRAPAKTQAALFEVMEERQVTVDGVRYPLEPPFNVFATQNPIEQEGTYRLPEAQLDRFLFKVRVDHPAEGEELEILKAYHGKEKGPDPESLDPVIDRATVQELRRIVEKVHVEEGVLRYIARIVDRTRGHRALYLGASPRASLSILSASKAVAALQGRDFVSPEDIKYVAPSVMAHRIILTPEKEMEGERTEDVIASLIDEVEVPR
jgi:MoxR-like ATPase